MEYGVWSRGWGNRVFGGIKFAGGAAAGVLYNMGIKGRYTLRIERMCKYDVNIRTSNQCKPIVNR